MPVLPAICERSGLRPLMAQPGGATGYSGNSCWRTAQLFDLGQAAPNNVAVLIVKRRKDSGATKQPFQSPLRLLLAASRSTLKRAFAERSVLSAQPSCTIH